jgi:methanogenic corrinoid protein MtbC1/DNA-binding XRE family transcriptional regulator
MIMEHIMKYRAKLLEDASVSYLEHILQGEQEKAEAIVTGLVAAGVEIHDIYIHVLQVAMAAIGNLWIGGDVSIAEEHRATEITVGVIERVRLSSPRRLVHGKRVTVGCVAGEQHTLGAKMIAELLYVDGWTVDYLGPNVPADSLVQFIIRTNPSLIAISMVLSDNSDTASATLAAVRIANKSVPILLGGPAIGTEEIGFAMGANAVVHDAVSAVTIARELVGAPNGESLDELLGRVGAQIQNFRRRQGWSQKDLADSAGLDRTYVSAVENGKQNLTLAALHKLTSALGVNEDQLFSV